MIFPDGIAISQTIQQVAGAIGIAIMVSILSAKKENSYLTTIVNEATEATAAGSSFVFKIGLLLAIINVVFNVILQIGWTEVIQSYG